MSMRALKIGFVLDPPEKIKCLEDTSFYIMKEAYERGHEIFYLDSRDIWARGEKILARAKTVVVNFNDGFKALQAFDSLSLESLDLIFIRKDPPFDSHYLYLTYLLELLKGKVPIWNDPAGIRNANEKLYILNFPERIPETLVASQIGPFLEFLGDVKDIVLKPLCERGGVDVIRLKKENSEKEKIISEHLDKYGSLMAQRFLPEVQTTGDKRILLLVGEILGGYVRIPPRGDFRVSVFHDGRYEPATLSDQDRELVKEISPKLLRDGLYFVGLDVIGDLISEINVTSPAGIPEINHFAGEKLEEKVVSFLEHFASAGNRV